MDTQAALVQQLQGTVMTDRAQEGAARLNVDYTRLTAPISGRIGLRVVDPGNYVTAGDAAGIATITQMAPMDVQFSVPQDRVQDIQLAQTQAGKQPLEVTAWDRTRTTQLDGGQFAAMVPLGAIARVYERAAPTSINHQDGELATTISFNLEEGASLEDARQIIAQAEADIAMPTNVRGGF